MMSEMTHAEMARRLEGAVRDCMAEDMKPAVIHEVDRIVDERLTDLVDYELRRRMVPPQRTIRVGPWVVSIRRERR